MLSDFNGLKFYLNDFTNLTDFSYAIDVTNVANFTDLADCYKYKLF